MVGESSELRVVYSPEALADLDGIWEWNAHAYGIPRANGYVQFLRDATEARLRQGIFQPVLARPAFRYLTVRRRSKSHGHVIILELIESDFRVLRVFHTAQDWTKYLAKE